MSLTTLSRVLCIELDTSKTSGSVTGHDNSQAFGASQWIGKLDNRRAEIDDAAMDETTAAQLSEADFMVYRLTSCRRTSLWTIYGHRQNLKSALTGLRALLSTATHLGSFW